MPIFLSKTNFSVPRPLRKHVGKLVQNLSFMFPATECMMNPVHAKRARVRESQKTPKGVSFHKLLVSY